MVWIALALAVIGLLLLLIGFARNSRGMLVVAAILLFLAGSAGDFLDRWVGTAKQAEAEARALQGLPAAPAIGPFVDADADRVDPASPDAATPASAPAAQDPAGVAPPQPDPAPAPLPTP